MNSLKRELYELKAIMGLIQIKYCTDDEEKIIRDDSNGDRINHSELVMDEYGSHYRIGEPLLSDSEENELIKLRFLDLAIKQEKSLRRMVKGWYALIGGILISLLLLILSVLIPRILVFFI